MRSRRARGATLVLAATLGLASACSFGPPDPDQQGAPPNLPTPSSEPSAGAGAEAPSGGSQEVAITVLAKDLDVPWGMAFLPDGSGLVTERDTGRILKVGPESDAEGLTVTQVHRLTESKASGDGGLLGIAVSPKYETDKTVYVYYSTATDNRVAKLTLGGKVQPILTGIPRSLDFNGGALAFGPDGFLYAGTGDGTPKSTQAQNPKSLGGKILRMTVAGKPAPGNPVGTSLVWSSGHRNVQGLAWDKTKRMYASESGQTKSGELNVIAKGKNYGWPKADGAGSDAKLTNPVFSWPAAESGCSGVAVLEQTVANACLLGQRVYLLTVTGNGTVLGTPQAALTGEYGRLRSLAAAPDGSLWAGTSNQEDDGDPGPDDDRIIRLVFSEGGAGRS
ncbi:PQQ-dependent sugar dehydrogenase [Actinoplanes sp. TRM 88003]|uniref:PQQ-dependent sugar dehydrogenase n=1 Tax=Paractinoplanes aksuensis TaxID=2939490 RepID=A0ABT1DML9_9ACTN|nr:PQQ-dependent sugar dehydrogenase [Actinoplanes aksuensis]